MEYLGAADTYTRAETDMGCEADGSTFSCRRIRIREKDRAVARRCRLYSYARMHWQRNTWCIQMPNSNGSIILERCPRLLWKFESGSIECNRMLSSICLALRRFQLFHHRFWLPFLKECCSIKTSTHQFRLSCSIVADAIVVVHVFPFWYCAKYIRFTCV